MKDIFLTIIPLAIAFSADAFAVSICKGLCVQKVKAKHSLIVGLWFGLFQAIMPIIGYFLAFSFIKYIEAFDHWIVLVLLCLIGANMIRESFKKEEEEECNISFGIKSMLPLAIATSIDALAGGVAISVDGINLWIAITFIGLITFGLSALGVVIGNKFGKKYKSKAELAGGIILILLGVKIVIEHLFF